MLLLNINRLSYQCSLCSSIWAFWVCSFLLLCGSSECVTQSLAGKIPAIFAYGDSIVDQGNNNALNSAIARCNFLPYGKDFVNGPTGRFSNGKTPPDLLAEALGIADTIPAYLDPLLELHGLKAGVSFASGGAGYDPLTSSRVEVIPLSQQLEYLKEYFLKLKGQIGEGAANNVMSKGIHLVSCGSDDFCNNYFNNKTRLMQYSTSSYVDFLVGLASTFVQDLYKIGARRIGVFSTPPLGYLPSQRTGGGGPKRLVVKKYNQVAQLFNSKLSSAVDSFKRSLPQSKVVFIDIYNVTSELAQNPQKYGFQVSDRGCCGSGTFEVNFLCNILSGTCPDDTKYVFWDSFHPTQQGYKFIVDEIAQRYFSKFL